MFKNMITDTYLPKFFFYYDFAPNFARIYQHTDVFFFAEHNFFFQILSEKMVKEINVTHRKCVVMKIKTSHMRHNVYTTRTSLDKILHAK